MEIPQGRQWQQRGLVPAVAASTALPTAAEVDSHSHFHVLRLNSFGCGFYLFDFYVFYATTLHIVYAQLGCHIRQAISLSVCTSVCVWHTHRQQLIRDEDSRISILVLSRPQCAHCPSKRVRVRCLSHSLPQAVAPVIVTTLQQQQQHSLNLCWLFISLFCIT